METQRSSGGAKFWTMIVLFTVLGSATLGAYLMAAPANVNRFYPGGLSLVTGGDGYSIGADVQLSRSAANIWTLGAGDSLIGITDLNATDVHASNLYANSERITATLPYSYIVNVTGATYYAKNGQTGEITSSATFSTLMQSLVNALPSGGKIVLKEGTYTSTARISLVKSDVQIVGSGWGTVLTNAAGMTDPIFRSETSATTGIYLGNFKVDGNSANCLGSAYGIIGLGVGVESNKITIENIWFYNLPQGAIYCNPPNRINYMWVRNCLFDTVAQRVASQAINVKTSNYITIDNCKFYNCGTAAFVCNPINIDYCKHVDVSNIEINTVYGHGVMILYGSTFVNINNVVGTALTKELVCVEWQNDLSHGHGQIPNEYININNIVHNGPMVDQWGIYIQDARHVTLSNSQVKGAATLNHEANFYVANCTDITVNNCIGVNAPTGAYILDIRSAIGVMVSNFIANVTTATGRGINIDSGCSDVSITHFYIHNCPGGTFITDAGTNTKLHFGVGYITENSGTATVLSGSTSIAFTHGLSITPSASWFDIIFTENSTNLVSSHWLTCNATHAVLNVNTDPGASNLDFGWKAIKP